MVTSLCAFCRGEYHSNLVLEFVNCATNKKETHSQQLPLWLSWLQLKPELLFGMQLDKLIDRLTDFVHSHAITSLNVI